jgi:hypothetical protein
VEQQEEQRREKERQSVQPDLQSGVEGEGMKRRQGGQPARVHLRQPSPRDARHGEERRPAEQDGEEPGEKDGIVQLPPRGHEQVVERRLPLEAERLVEGVSQPSPGRLQRVGFVDPDVQANGERQRDREVQAHERGNGEPTHLCAPG